MALNDAKKRDFVAQIIELVTNNQVRLTEVGYALK